MKKTKAEIEIELDALDRELRTCETKAHLIELASKLNNRSEHITQDKVTILAFMDYEQGYRHVLSMFLLTCEKMEA